MYLLHTVITMICPMLVQTGQDEMLLSDSTTIIDKSKDNNGDAKLITYPGMFHTFTS